MLKNIKEVLHISALLIMPICFVMTWGKPISVETVQDFIDSATALIVLAEMHKEERK